MAGYLRTLTGGVLLAVLVSQFAYVHHAAHEHSEASQPGNCEVCAVMERQASLGMAALPVIELVAARPILVPASPAIVTLRRPVSHGPRAPTSLRLI
jgi:hypothetical protein